MSKPKVELIVGDRRTKECGAWDIWLTEAAKLAVKFSEVEDDPFSYNEAATVSLLTAAAFQAGMLGLAEFISTKKNREDRRYNVPGRCDLWLSSETCSWALEFKQKFYRDGTHRTGTILSWLEEAVTDARAVSHFEAERRFGCLVISFYGSEGIEPTFIENLHEAIEEVDFAWFVDPNTPHSSSTYFLFKKA